MEIPVYLFTGFLESGKTTFIQEVLAGEEFDSSGEFCWLERLVGIGRIPPYSFSYISKECVQFANSTCHQ